MRQKQPFSIARVSWESFGWNTLPCSVVRCHSQVLGHGIILMARASLPEQSLHGLRLNSLNQCTPSSIQRLSEKQTSWSRWQALLYIPRDEIGMSLQYVGLSPQYTVLQPGRSYVLLQYAVFCQIQYLGTIVTSRNCTNNVAALFLNRLWVCWVGNLAEEKSLCLQHDVPHVPPFVGCII
jgi:hypothetical protein